MVTQPQCEQKRNEKQHDAQVKAIPRHFESIPFNAKIEKREIKENLHVSDSEFYIGRSFAKWRAASSEKILREASRRPASCRLRN